MSAHILIVEDEEPLTLLLRYNLESEGYEVETASRGDEADTRLRERTPDLVVLDWMLPAFPASSFAAACVPGRRPGNCRSSC